MTARARVMMVHNYYRTSMPSGENVSFEQERDLLAQNGHEVVTYTRNSQEIEGYPACQKLALPFRTVWAADSRRQLHALLRQHRPEVVHFQNTFPLISPAAYQPCREEGIPVVQALRNYRLFCLNALFARENGICEDCAGRLPWPGVVRGCYHDSIAQSAVLGGMIALHQWLGTWQKHVDLFVVATEFARRKFMEHGFPAEKLMLKPNYVPDSGVREGAGEYALFIGRLDGVKGIGTLLKAWKSLPHVPLKIAGSGPELESMRAQAEDLALNVQFLGQRPYAEVTRLIKGARFLVFPSEWYETFGRVAVEAFAAGVPVILSRIGAIEELVSDGFNGYHFEPGNADELAEKASWTWDNPRSAEEMGHNARSEYEEKYTASRNYEILQSIYQRALRLRN